MSNITKAKSYRNTSKWVYVLPQTYYVLGGLLTPWKKKNKYFLRMFHKPSPFCNIWGSFKSKIEYKLYLTIN